MNILLFSDVPPCTNYSAGIVLNKLCGVLLSQGHQVDCFTLLNPDLRLELPEDKLDRMVFRSEDKPKEDFGGGLASYRGNSRNARTVLPAAADHAAAFAKERGSELLWIVEQGQSIIKSVRLLVERTGLPYVMQTWDSPEWWMRANHYDAITKKSVMRAYAEGLQGAQCFIAASWVMEREFLTKYQCKRAKAVVLGFPEGKVTPAGEKKNDEFIIAMCGQVYATEEFERLVIALNDMKWKLGGKTVYLDLYVTSLPQLNLPFLMPKNVRIQGWRSQDELLPELADADLLYCPYWFNEDFRTITSTSFPSKLSTYLKVGTATVIHAPDYASPAVFVKENDAGYVIDTLEEKPFAKRLKEIMRAKDHKAVGQRGYAAFQRFLTEECMARDFMDALSLPFAPEKLPKPCPPEKVIRVTHVNNVDLLGNRFNGYDMLRSCKARDDVVMKQIVLNKMSAEENVVSIGEDSAALMVRNLCETYEWRDGSRALIQPFAGRIRRSKEFEHADLIHYHLLHNGVVSYVDMPELCRLKPSVLTVHDPWILTGHCIHPIECKKWLTGCGNCPHLDRDFAMIEDRTALMWQIRKQLFSEMADTLDLVVASKWMRSLVEASPITRQVKHVHEIPFGINLRQFSPLKGDLRQLREKHKLPADDFIVLFRQDPSPFKGVSFIIKALNGLKDKRHLTVLTVGAVGIMKELKGFDDQIVELPWMTDSQIMAELYQCCDVFLMPSIAESFGMMSIEAMACGKPVICFEDTAVTEVTHAPEIGIAVPMNDAHALRAAIQELRSSPADALRRGEMGRKLCEERYSYNDYLENHLALYRKILARK